MDDILRQLAIWICCPIYKLIPIIYDVFYKLANHRFFEDETIENLTSNIYVLVSVVMLFAFSANLLAAIVNPDLINDKKKGIGALFKRSIIGIVLIVLIPFAFDRAYDIQQDVMDKSLIEKVLVGISYTDSENSGGNGGQVIAGTLISSVLHPVDNNIGISVNVSEDYTDMVATDITKINKVAKHINVAPSNNSSYEYAFEFESLVAILAGGLCCYFLLLFSFDMAVRTVKLAFLELTAPISVIAYIAAGDNFLKKWFGEVGKTFLDVFMRIACMAFYIFIIGNLDQFLIRVDGGWFVKVLLLVGVLIFVKQLPDFINKLFGTNIKLKGGIGGRLGEMAAVGGIAKKGWETVSKGLRNAATLGLAAPIALPTAALGYGINRATNGGLVKGLKTIGSGLKTTGTILKGFSSGNPVTAIPNAIKGYKETNSAKERASEKERKKMSDLASIANLNEIGKVNDNELSTIINGNNNLLNKIGSDVGLTGRQKEAIKGKIAAEQINSLAKKAKESNEKITSQFDTMIANSINNPELNNKLKMLKDGYMNGNMKLGEVASKLKVMAESGEIGAAEANTIITNSNKLVSISGAISDIKANPDSTLGKFMNENNLSTFIDEDGKLKSSKISILAGATDTYATNAKTVYDSISGTASETSKATMERYDKTASMVTAEYARKTSEKENPYESAKYNLSANSQSQQNTNNSASSTGSYNQQYNIDDYNIQSSGDMKLKNDGQSQETVQQRVDRINNVNDNITNDFDRSVQEAQYEDLFNSDEYNRYAEENGVHKQPKFKLKDED